MTGKQLKAWAATIHDEAIIEIDVTALYTSGWKELELTRIRSMLITQPTRTMEDVCNAVEDL